MIEETVIEKSIAFAREKMKNLKPSHGWDHVQRVVLTAGRIADAEGADLFIVKAAAILHDIAREAQDASRGKEDHAQLGGVMAFDFLKEAGLDEERARYIADCVATHRYRGNSAPATLEAKVVYDADKLDSVGAVGIGRAFLFAGEVGAKLHNHDADIRSTSAYSEEDTAYREFTVKLKNIKDKMLTEEGRRIARERHDFMVGFFERLDAEVDGKA